jgi:hypothetical protein
MIKKLIQTALAGLILITASSFISDNTKHIGLWKGEEDGEIGFMEFSSEGFITLIMGNDTVGGESFEVDGEILSLKYEVDYNPTPHHIYDFNLQRICSNQRIR